MQCTTGKSMSFAIDCKSISQGHKEAWLFGGDIFCGSFHESPRKLEGPVCCYLQSVLGVSKVLPYQEGTSVSPEKKGNTTIIEERLCKVTRSITALFFWFPALNLGQSLWVALKQFCSQRNELKRQQQQKRFSSSLISEMSSNLLTQTTNLRWFPCMC